MTCICTLIKNEQEYLEDWLRYHINLGIDKIFIVEDIGSESHKSIIEKYSDNVEILNIPFDEQEFKRTIYSTRQGYYQSKMFKYVRSLNKFDWCFIMDIDEYVTLEDKRKTLEDILSEFNEYSEVMLYWKNYGANGHINKPDYSKVESFREYYTKECGYTEFDTKMHYINKKVINMHKISSKYRVLQHPPSMITYTNTELIKDYKNPTFNKIYLKHYITKSWEEYKWKLLTRGMCCKNHRKIDDFFEMNTELLNVKEELINNLQL